ncbi:UNVERIFIED_CONTAM: hypothetical protein FKN15_027993 [Acipenser sinensis]
MSGSDENRSSVTGEREHRAGMGACQDRMRIAPPVHSGHWSPLSSDLDEEERIPHIWMQLLIQICWSQEYLCKTEITAGGVV